MFQDWLFPWNRFPEPSLVSLRVYTFYRPFPHIFLAPSFLKRESNSISYVGLKLWSSPSWSRILNNLPPSHSQVLRIQLSYTRQNLLRLLHLLVNCWVARFYIFVSNNRGQQGFLLTSSWYWVLLCKTLFIGMVRNGAVVCIPLNLNKYNTPQNNS